METKQEVLGFENSKARLKRYSGLRGLSKRARELGSSILLKMLCMVLRSGGTPEYDQVEDEGKISILWKEQGLNLGCCDCGLVHYINFEVIDDVIVMIIRRNEEETSAHREEGEFGFTCNNV